LKGAQKLIVRLKEDKDAFEYDNAIAQTLKDDLIKKCWGNQNASEL
jgi:hypothetical protein